MIYQQDSPEDEGDVDIAQGSMTAESSGELHASKSPLYFRLGSTKLDPAHHRKSPLVNTYNLSEHLLCH